MFCFSFCSPEEFPQRIKYNTAITYKSSPSSLFCLFSLFFPPVLYILYSVHLIDTVVAAVVFFLLLLVSKRQ